MWTLGFTRNCQETVVPVLISNAETPGRECYCFPDVVFFSNKTKHFKTQLEAPSLSTARPIRAIQKLKNFSKKNCDFDKISKNLLHFLQQYPFRLFEDVATDEKVTIWLTKEIIEPFNFLENLTTFQKFKIVSKI